MILAADDVRDVHLQIVNDVDKMKHGLSVGTQDDEVGINLLAVGQLADDIADDQIVNRNRLALHLEFDGALVFVGEAVGEQGFDARLIVGFALGLEIRAAIALAGAGGVAGERAFVPIKAEPAQAVEDDIHGFLRIARGVGILDAQDKRAAGVPGVKPVEQRGARATNVEVAGG